MEYDIFISYSRDDSAIVNTFVQQLEAAGYKVWIDKTGIYTGSRFKSVLVQAIEDSKVFLFFSSKDANASPWTAKEVAIAVDRKKTIIPIKLDNTRYNRAVEFDIIGLDYVDYSIRSRRGQELKKLMRTLENIFGKKPTTPKQVVQASQGKKSSSLLKNHRGWVITLAVMALLLIVGVPLYFSTTGKDSLSLVVSAEQGNPEAQYKLGYCYYKGDSVTQDYDMAIKWFKKAAEQGHAKAQSKLGDCYYLGYGVPQDYKEAVKWYRKAAEQGDAGGQTSMGICYYIGDGVTQDYKESVKWFRKAAEQGSYLAQYVLGKCYEHGQGVIRDYEEAVNLYRKAAEQDFTEALYELGHCYENGDGVTKDRDVAIMWYQKAAEQGNERAQYRLGDCYFYGDGETKDMEKSVEWYRKAAEQGLADAQYKLGFCYEHGYGVKKDMEKALEWYKKAAEQDDDAAKEAVKRLTGD